MRTYSETAVTVATSILDMKVEAIINLVDALDGPQDILSALKKNPY